MATKHGKKFREAAAKVDRAAVYTPLEAVTVSYTHLSARKRAAIIRESRSAGPEAARRAHRDAGLGLWPSSACLRRLGPSRPPKSPWVRPAPPGTPSSTRARSSSMCPRSPTSSR